MYKLRKVDKTEQQLVATVDSILKKQRIAIQKRVYYQFPWQQIFSFIESIEARQLSLFNNDAPICLKAILQPQFITLQHLYLGFNQIANIQAFSRLNAPNLKEINLATNKVTKIKPLRKAHLPMLQQLNLSHNPIFEPECLTETDFKRIKQLHLQIWPNLPYIGETKRWLAKLSCQPRNLSKLNLRSSARRREQHIDNIIKQKYQSLKTD